MLFPGLVSGAVQAVMFNPFDRALFLRVLHRRSFFCRQNWTSPFQGFGNAALYRTLCGASYLVWQDLTMDALERNCGGFVAERPLLAQLTVGFVAGTLNGLILNKLQVVKYQIWSTAPSGETTSVDWRKVTRGMWRHGGVRVFFRGVSASILRDSCFGMIYETLRRSGQNESAPKDDAAPFFHNLGAAVIAGTATAPLNYCRNIIYGSPITGSPQRMRQLMRQLLMEAAWKPTLRDGAALLNARLNIVLGAVRVGVGMAVGQYIFDVVKLFTVCQS